ncbi:hypothetical protein GCM10020220_106430 [Nonomuraea rubra]
MPAKKRGRRTRLVIVESPAKAKTIAGYLGRGYIVESSIGPHPRPAGEGRRHPREVQGSPWARLGVNVEHGFEPLYVVNHEQTLAGAKLRQLLKDADELLLVPPHLPLQSLASPTTHFHLSRPNSTAANPHPPPFTRHPTPLPTCTPPPTIHA